MDLFEFCLKIFKREAHRFNVYFNQETTSQLTFANAAHVNYDIAHNRCAFLYRCGAINLQLAKDCFKKFLSEHRSIVLLLSNGTSPSDLNYCSISKGPALDYVALLLSYQESGILPSLFNNIKIVTKNGAWRNAVNIIHNIISEGHLKGLPPSLRVGDMEVIQGDPFQNFNEKVKGPISNSDVVMMMRALNLKAGVYNPETISKSIWEVIDALKPGAIIFCIDNKSSIKEITQQLSSFPGKFLLEPIVMEPKIDLENATFYKNLFGCNPICNAQGSFFAWQKFSVSASGWESSIEKVSKMVRCPQISSHSSADNDFCNTSADGYNVEVFRNAFTNIDYLSAGPYPNKIVQASDCFVKKSENISDSLQSDFSSSTANFCMQTEPENICKGAEDDKISKIICRFENLTLELTEILQNNILNSNKHDDTFKSLEKTYKPSVPEGIVKGVEDDKFSKLTERIANLTRELTKILENQLHSTDQDYKNPENICKSSVPENTANSHCSIFSPLDSYCTQNDKMSCCCKILKCQHCFSFTNQFKSNVSRSDCESNNCHFSNNVGSKFSIGNNSPSTAHLVIPLDKLSANVVSQIISLINQSNQEK